MRVLGIVIAFAAVSLAACARQPRPNMLRPVTPAALFGDSGLAQVSSAPRAREWSDDVIVQAQPGAHVAIFEFTRKGKPQLRVVQGGEVRAASSIHWRTRGFSSGGMPAGFHGSGTGESVCTSPGFVQTGPGGMGYTTPVTCTESRKRPGYAPSYSQSRHAEYRPVLVVVGDSAFRPGDEKRLLRAFVESHGNPIVLGNLASAIVRAGRWVAVVHSPARVQ